MVLRRRSPKLHPGASGHRTERLGKVPTFLLHHKLEDIAPFIALSEAVPTPRFREDHESGCARVGMKRTEPRKIFPRSTQLDGFGDQIDDVDPGFYFIYRAHDPAGESVKRTKCCLPPG